MSLVSGARAATLSPTSRSAKTNGSQTFLGKVDGRGAKPRRLRDIEQSLARDIGTDLRNIATGERALITQASTLILRTEELQATAARGEPIGGDELVRVTNALRRVLSDLKRRTKAVAPKAANLRDFLAARTPPAPAAEDAA